MAGCVHILVSQIKSSFNSILSVVIQNQVCSYVVLPLTSTSKAYSEGLCGQIRAVKVKVITNSEIQDGYDELASSFTFQKCVMC